MEDEIIKEITLRTEILIEIYQLVEQQSNFAQTVFEFHSDIGFN